MALPQPVEPDGVENIPKPNEPRATVSMKVACVMSMPELAHTANMFSVIRSFALAGITVHKGTGCWWEQSLSRLLYKIVDQKYDYVMTVDYDSVFDPPDVMRLLQLAATFPEASVIFATQYRRNVDEIICAVKSEAGPLGGVQPLSIFERELTPAHVGHFGLTIIRVADLARIPHPWFWSQPNEQGKWESGKIDADIHFWRQLGVAGMKAFQANKVRIGHSQKVITTPGESLEPLHLYHPQWDQAGSLAKAIENEKNLREVKAMARAECDKMIHNPPASKGFSSGD